MSYRLVALCFDIPSLSIWEFAVMCAIARAADNKDYTCFPSVDTIATYSHASPRQTQRTIQALIRRGLITRTTQGREGAA